MVFCSPWGGCWNPFLGAGAFPGSRIPGQDVSLGLRHGSRVRWEPCRETRNKAETCPFPFSPSKLWWRVWQCDSKGKSEEFSNIFILRDLSLTRETLKTGDSAHVLVGSSVQQTWIISTAEIPICCHTHPGGNVGHASVLREPSTCERWLAQESFTLGEN